MSIILNRLKKSWENDCPEKICSCGNSDCNCQENNNEPEFVLKENLSDEEIEEIIETEYKDKNESEQFYIKKFLKKFGNRYSYHKLDFSKDSSIGDSRYKTITITCREHGDFNIKGAMFLSIGCPACYISKDKENINKLLKSFKYIDLPATRKYLEDKIMSGNITDIDMLIKSIIVKEDLISLANSKRNDLDLFDLSSIKDVVLGSGDKFTIKYKSVKDETIKEWVTDMRHFIDRKQIPVELSYNKSWNTRYSKTNYGEIARSKLEAKYPNMDFSNFKYEAMKKPITMTCKIHGTEVTYHTVDSLLKDGSDYICPDCAREHRSELSEAGAFAHKTTEDFIKQCENLYGNGGRYDYSKTKYINYNVPVIIYDNVFKEFFEVFPNNFLRKSGNPRNHMSFGETLVYNSLIKIRDNYISDLIIKYDVNISDEIEGRKTNRVRIDFICTIKSKQIWIEYNGEQHYESTYFEHLRDENKWEEEYKNQIKRDKNVVKYCIDNDISLIVIPYTYKDLNSIYDILYGILVENKNQDDLIIPVEVKEI